MDACSQSEFRTVSSSSSVRLLNTDKRNAYKNYKTIKQRAIGSYILLTHVLIKHTDYKVPVIDCASFGDEFFCYAFAA